MKKSKFIIILSGVIFINMNSAMALFSPSLQSKLTSCVKNTTLEALRDGKINHTTSKNKTINSKLISIISSDCEEEFERLDKAQNMAVHIYGTLTSPILSAQRKFEYEMESKRIQDLENLPTKERFTVYLKEAKLVK